MLGLGAGGLARLLPPAPAGIFAGTLILGVSTAVAQPAAAVVVRAWFPAGVQRAATAYALALNIGGLAGASLTAYIVIFGGWRGSFFVWSIPALAAAGLWFLLAPAAAAREAEPHDLGALVRDRGVWSAAGLFGSQSIVYFTTATWVPFLLRDRGAGYVALVLFLLGVSLLPAGFVLAFVRRPFATRRAFYAAAGLLTLTGAAGFAAGLKDLA